MAESYASHESLWANDCKLVYQLVLVLASLLKCIYLWVHCILSNRLFSHYTVQLVLLSDVSEVTL